VIESKAILAILDPRATELIFSGGTHLHRRIVMPGFGPRKEREAEINGGGVQTTRLWSSSASIGSLTESGQAMVIQSCAKSAANRLLA
jgi:hypothetical protein